MQESNRRVVTQRLRGWRRRLGDVGADQYTATLAAGHDRDQHLAAGRCSTITDVCWRQPAVSPVEQCDRQRIEILPMVVIQ